MILPESAAKMLITVDANPHDFGHLCLCQTGMLTFTYYACNADYSIIARFSESTDCNYTFIEDAVREGS